MKRTIIAMLLVLFSLSFSNTSAGYNPCSQPGLTPPLVQPGTVPMLYQICLDVSANSLSSSWTNMYAYYARYYVPTVYLVKWDSSKPYFSGAAPIYGAAALNAMLTIANQWAGTGELNGSQGIWSTLNYLTNYLRSIATTLTSKGGSKVAIDDFLHAELAAVNAQLTQQPGSVDLQHKRTMLIGAIAAVAVTP